MWRKINQILSRLRPQEQTRYVPPGIVLMFIRPIVLMI